MKICTKHLNFTKMVDVARIIDREMRHLIPDTLVKYTDGSSETFKILYVTTSEIHGCVGEPSIAWGAVDCTDTRWTKIPFVVGMLNGFLIVDSKVKRYSEEGVIDLFVIEAYNNRINNVLKQMTPPHLQ